MPSGQPLGGRLQATLRPVVYAATRCHACVRGQLWPGAILMSVVHFTTEATGMSLVRAAT